jgi:hypothetical protein
MPPPGGPSTRSSSTSRTITLLLLGVVVFFVASNDGISFPRERSSQRISASAWQWSANALPSRDGCFLGPPSSLVATEAPQRVRCEDYGLQPRRKPAIMIDAYLINNEAAPIVARVLETASVADYMILLESNLTFTDIPRNLTLPNLMPCLERFGARMTHEVVHPGNFGGNRLAWSRETHLRNSLGTAAARLVERLKEESGGELKDEDILFAVSDVDEMPRPLTYQVAKSCTGWKEPAGLHLLFYYYNFRWKKQAFWGNGPRIFPWPMIAEGKYKPQDAREWVPNSPEPVLLEGGWHLGYFLPAADIQAKLRSFAHTEFNQPPYNTLEWIEGSIDSGRDLFNRGSQEHMVESDCADPAADIPQAVKANPALLARFCPGVTAPGLLAAAAAAAASSAGGSGKVVGAKGKTRGTTTK